MSDARELLERQAAWQKGRRNLSWPEKVRMAEAVRDSVAKFSSKGRQGASSRPSAERKTRIGNKDRQGSNRK